MDNMSFHTLGSVWTKVLHRLRISNRETYFKSVRDVLPKDIGPIKSSKWRDI